MDYQDGSIEMRCDVDRNIQLFVTTPIPGENGRSAQTEKIEVKNELLLDGYSHRYA